MTQSLIPEWYSSDWNPAQGRGELPQMSWEALEAAISDMQLPPSRTTAAVTLCRTLWLESARLTPLDLLQRLLVMGAVALDTGRLKTSSLELRTIPTPATGMLPRWSYTDLEVVLAYTWQGTAMTIVTQRHRDLLSRRGEGLSAQETARQFLLLVSGLPIPAAQRTQVPGLQSPRRLNVAA